MKNTKEYKKLKREYEAYEKLKMEVLLDRIPIFFTPYYLLWGLFKALLNLGFWFSWIKR